MLLVAANCCCRELGLAKGALKPARFLARPFTWYPESKEEMWDLPFRLLLIPPNFEDIALSGLPSTYNRSQVHLPALGFNGAV